MDILTKKPVCKEHDYVDLYGAWGWLDDDGNEILVWMICKHCLDKKRIIFDMRGTQ